MDMPEFEYEKDSQSLLIKGDNVKPVFGFASQKYGGCYLLDQRL
jgi:hypothetical protein